MHGFYGTNTEMIKFRIGYFSDFSNKHFLLVQSENPIKYRKQTICKDSKKYDMIFDKNIIATAWEIYYSN